MFNQENALPKINVAVIGNNSVGKRSLIYKYLYPFDYQPVEKLHSVTIHHDNKMYNVKFYEQSLLPYMVKHKHCGIDDPIIHVVFVVYDITNKQSFRDITYEWNNLIQDILFKSHGVVCLVANKVDLIDREVVKESKALKMCSRFNYMYRRVCGLTGEGVEELFSDVLFWYITTKQRRCIKLINNRLNRKKEEEKPSCLN